MNNDSCKAFKNIWFGDKKIEKKIKLKFVWTYENMVKFQPFKSPQLLNG
jgi:hypothetical protein